MTPDEIKLALTQLQGQQYQVDDRGVMRRNGQSLGVYVTRSGGVWRVRSLTGKVLWEGAALDGFLTDYFKTKGSQP